MSKICPWTRSGAGSSWGETYVTCHGEECMMYGKYIAETKLETKNGDMIVNKISEGCTVGRRVCE